MPGTSQKTSELSEQTVIDEDDYFPSVDLSETAGTNARNKRAKYATLRAWLLSEIMVSTDVSAGAQEVAVSWPATISPTPTVAPVAMFYPSALEDVGIVCWLKGGTLSGSGVTVILSSDNHSGGKLTVLMPPPGTA